MKGSCEGQAHIYFPSRSFCQVAMPVPVPVCPPCQITGDYRTNEDNNRWIMPTVPFLSRTTKMSCVLCGEARRASSGSFTGNQATRTINASAAILCSGRVKARVFRARVAAIFATTGEFAARSRVEAYGVLKSDSDSDPTRF